MSMNDEKCQKCLHKYDGSCWGDVHSQENCSGELVTRYNPVDLLIGVVFSIGIMAILSLIVMAITEW